MTDENPARAAFLKDQEDAQAEEQTRDQVSWELNIRNGEAQAALTEAQATLHFSMATEMETKARVWATTAGAVAAVALAACLLSVAWAVAIIVGAFR